MSTTTTGVKMPTVAQVHVDPLDLHAITPESLALWMRAVRTMDRDTLDSFVRRTWRTWSAASLRPLAVAVDLRRAELDGE